MANVKLEINQAQENDLEEILKLQKLAYIQEAEIYNNFEITPLTQNIEDLEKDFKTTLFLKAVYDSKIIGSIKGFQEKGAVLVGKLIVHPNYQNKGLGTQLMLALEKQFPEAKRFWLFTAYKSEKNLYLYKKLEYLEYKRENLDPNPTMIYLEKKT